MVASGLVDNLSVTHLDLSHNRVADRGVRALAKLLDSRSVLAFLDLCDNQIHTEGGRALARALRGNHSLLSLNLRLNRIGDDGGRAICDVLRVRALVPSLIHPVCYRTDFSNGMKEVQQKGMDIYFFTSSHPRRRLTQLAKTRRPSLVKCRSMSLAVSAATRSDWLAAKTGGSD